MLSHLTHSLLAKLALIGVQLVAFLIAFSGTLSGQEWIFFRTPFEKAWYSGFHFLDKDTGWVATIVNQDLHRPAVLHTTDGGENWVVQTPALDGYLECIYFADHDTGYASGQVLGSGAIILKTTNGGQQWLQQTSPVTTASLVSMFFVSGTKGWIVGQDWNGPPLILHTSDGTNWVASSYPLKAAGLSLMSSLDAKKGSSTFTSSMFTSVYFYDANNGWIGGVEWVGETAVPVILHTTDGGQTWARQNPSIPAGEIVDLFFLTKDIGYAVGGPWREEGVLTTTNGGETWTSLGTWTGPSATAVRFVSPQQGYVAATQYEGESWNSQLYKTTDSGKTWTKFGNQLNGLSVDQLQVLAKDTGATIVGNCWEKIGKIDDVIEKPPVAAWVDDNGVLQVKLQGNANVKIGVDGNGNVVVNGQKVGEPPAKAANIKGIHVEGGDGGNVIDLRDVKRAAFSGLADGQITLCGGDGNDEVYGSEFGDQMAGGEGDDYLEGGEGNDIQDGGQGKDTLDGGEGDDYQDGHDGDDRLYGGKGDDYQNGSDGDDRLYGGDGNDKQYGDYGDDTLYGGEGDDIQNGGLGRDNFFQHPGSADVVKDTDGNDTLDFSEADMGITIHLDLQDVDQPVDSAGNTVRLEGQFENYVGSAFNDVLFAGALDSTRTLNGGTGTDTLCFDAKGLPATDNGATITVPGFAPVNYTNFEAVRLIHLHVLVRIENTPPEATLMMGQQQQFTAMGYDANNNPVPVTPIWTASGGTITPGGLYTAGTVAGDYTVTATDSGTGIQGTATVHVTPTAVEQLTIIPTEFALAQNFPNPFNPQTTISFALPKACRAKLSVFDVHGREVALLADKDFAPGEYRVVFEAKDLASGLYFYRLETEGFVKTKKLVMVK